MNKRLRKIVLNKNPTSLADAVKFAETAEAQGRLFALDSDNEASDLSVLKSLQTYFSKGTYGKGLSTFSRQEPLLFSCVWRQDSDVCFHISFSC